MKDYLEKRQCAIDEISKEDLNKMFWTMIDLLGQSWLETEGNNPIQKLYKRTDFLSTNELLSFADAIAKIQKVDPKWLNGQLKHVKSKDINNTMGAIFEIMGFSYLISDSYSVKLALEGNPGIDGTIVYNNTAKINISMKRFGTSRFEKDFNKKMTEVKKYFTSLLKKSKLLSLECLIVFTRYPNNNDYNELKKILKEGIEQVKTSGPFHIKCFFAQITFSFIANYRLSIEYNSYIMLAASPLHKNEFKNILNKLEDACNNLITQKKYETQEEMNGIFIHLSETVALNKCKEKMQEYLNNNCDKPISFIYLYSPCVARTEKSNSSQIIHTIVPAINAERYSKWLANNGVETLGFEFFVGGFNENKPEMKLVANDNEICDVSEMYLYQSGKIYQNSTVCHNDEIVGDIVNIAPGIKLNAVLTIGGKKITIEGKFPEDDHLEII